MSITYNSISLEFSLENWNVKSTFVELKNMVNGNYRCHFKLYYIPYYLNNIMFRISIKIRLNRIQISAL
jgi:hypothetical protein